jgi:hypothetical protein
MGAEARAVEAYISCPSGVRELNSSLQCVPSLGIWNKTDPYTALAYFEAGTAVTQKWTGEATPYVVEVVMVG